MPVSYLTVTVNQAGQRIDNLLMAQARQLPKSRIYRALRNGEVRVNGKRVRPPYRVEVGDEVRIPPFEVNDAPPRIPPANAAQLAELTRSIILDAPQWLLINKPAGLPVHGGEGLTAGLIEWARELPQVTDASALQLVHRLDKATSGCLLLAKRRSTLVAFHEQLRLHQIDKRYLALVKGEWRVGERRYVTAPLVKNQLRGGERMVCVSEEGRPARTHFQALVVYPGATLVEARPITGRTHQIRVHAAHLGCPIAGDLRYGDADFNRYISQLGGHRLFLHASSLRFTPPEVITDGMVSQDQAISVSTAIAVGCPLPATLYALLQTLLQIGTR